MKKLSVIVPFRCENENSYHLVTRLEELSSFFSDIDEIEYLVVDSGSDYRYSKICKNICRENNIIYLYEDTRGQPFSLSSCRDYGVKHASGDVITFLDVDLRFPPDFWLKILQLIDLWGISFYKKSFLAIPCVYLTESGTKLFYEQEETSDKYLEYYLSYLQGFRENVESFASCSSVMLVDRLHYLSIGGHNPEFQGHGYEDFELYHRLLIEEGFIPEADNYLTDSKSWDTFTYNGFRSQFSIIARPALMLNIMVYHLWHPRPKNVSFYEPKKLVENRKRIYSAFENFRKNKLHPSPLISSRSLFSNIIFFGILNDNAFNTLRDIFPILGKPLCLSEYDLVDKDTLEVKSNLRSIINNFNIELFLFPNPYGNPCRLAIYRWCRENNFPYLCFERGALPDSWFFDPNGFNADSISYQNAKQYKPLEVEQVKVIENYIYECLNNQPTLEQQDVRVGARAILDKLKIYGKKVLFVPLQRPSDTVIKYFSGSVGGFDQFVDVIDKVALELKRYGWVTLAKKHPLEVEHPNFKNIIYVPDNTNFIDLIEASSAVALINSGVGVYSMMLEKPCYIFGEAFYSQDGVNYEVSREDILDKDAITKLAYKIMTGSVTVDRNKMLSFIYFLVTEFYSFGSPKITQRIENDKSRRTITTGIDFYDINLLNKVNKKYSRFTRRSITKNAPLFERFALDIHNKKKKHNSNLSVSNKPVTKLKSSLRKESDKVIQEVEFRKENRLKRKWYKFIRDPYKFFDDSKSSLIRPLRFFFKKN